jgi:hypothetical protein
MKRNILLTLLIVLIISIAGFSSSYKRYHRTDMPDPQSFNAHFGDMDTNGDDLVTWGELTAYFQNAEKKYSTLHPHNPDAGNLCVQPL